jgi:hypothetical protein
MKKKGFNFINKIKRIEKLEFLDELEEWNLIQEHYFILLAKKI